jgi:hypothetical protein
LEEKKKKIDSSIVSSAVAVVHPIEQKKCKRTFNTFGDDFDSYLHNEVGRQSTEHVQLNVFHTNNFRAL